MEPLNTSSLSFQPLSGLAPTSSSSIASAPPSIRKKERKEKDKKEEGKLSQSSAPPLSFENKDMFEEVNEKVALESARQEKIEKQKIKMQSLMDGLVFNMREEKAGESIEELAKKNIVTPLNLLYGYKGLKIETSELFRALERTYANPNLSHDQRRRLIKFTYDWTKSGLYHKDAKLLLEEISKKEDFKNQILFVLNEGLKEYFLKTAKTKTEIKSKVSNEKIDTAHALMAEVTKKGSFIENVTSLFKADCEELFVEELNSHFFERLSNIELSDVLEYTTKDENPNCALHPIVDDWNSGSCWIRDQILKQDSLEQRQIVINFFVNCALKAKNKGGFFTSQMILGALNYSVIVRLKGSFSKKSLEQIQLLDEIFDPKANFKRYQEELDRFSNEACLPAVGIYTRSNTFIKEGNPVLSEDGSKFNLYRCNLVAIKISLEWIKKLEFIKIECAKRSRKVNLSEVFEGKKLSDETSDKISKELRALEIKSP